MSTLARAETTEQRLATFGELVVRNRFVRALRIAVPLLGAMVLAVLAVKIFIGSLGEDFSFAMVTIDRNNLVIDAPTYAGASEDGTSFTVDAAAAKVPVDRTDLIDLVDAVFTVKKPSGMTMIARAPGARLSTTDQQVDVPGLMHVEDSRGTHGVLTQSVADIPGEVLTTTGAVDLTLSGGTTVIAETMVYEGKAMRYTFTAATLTLPSLPGETAYFAGKAEAAE